MLRLAIALGVMLANGAGLAQEVQISIEEGERISRIAACHDCHTVGFVESAGQIDPAAALKGNRVGYRGPWGTTYPVNIRIIAAGMSEDEWVAYLSSFEALPPMPWFSAHYFTEAESRSLYKYVKWLGEPGAAAPAYVPPGEEPTSPYIVLVPPADPAQAQAGR